MFLLKSCTFLVLVALTVAEVVDFKPCSSDVNSCEFHELRIDPCPQAETHAACHIRRRKATKAAFDFTPNFDADTLESGLSWVKSDDQELPLVSMDKSACKYTTCPVKAGQRQTFEMDVPIESKFPTSSYTIKWTLTAPTGQKCCFTHDIKVVR